MAVSGTLSSRYRSYAMVLMCLLCVAERTGAAVLSVEHGLQRLALHPKRPAAVLAE